MPFSPDPFVSENQSSVVLNLSAVVDNDLKRQLAELTIIGDSSYTVATLKKIESVDPATSGQLLRLYSSATLRVFSGVTLFVKGEEDSLRVMAYDIAQGTVGNCYFAAALVALADKYPNFIESMITETPDSTLAQPKYKVNLYKVENGTIIGPEPVEVVFQFNRGNDSMDVSGDYNDQGQAEIWTVVLEQAVAQVTMGGYATLDQGGTTSDSWIVLTGQNATTFDGIPFETNEGIANIISDYLGEGKVLAIGTRIGTATLSGNHAYYVKEVKRDSNGLITALMLLNPWGPPHYGAAVELKLARFVEELAVICVLDAIP